MAQPAPALTQDDPEKARQREEARLQACAQRWISELGISEKAQRRFLERAKKISRRYIYDTSQDERNRRYAILWSNTETTKPAVYARPPQPVVSRRFDDEDPVARAASEVLERSLSSSIDLQDLDGMFKDCRNDFVLIGRGTNWARYQPTYGPQIVPEPIMLQVVTTGEGSPDEYQDEAGAVYDAEAVQFNEAGEPFAQDEPYEPVEYEEALTDYVNWEDFGHSVARTWDEVSYVWRRVYLSRAQLTKRFGEELGKQVPLDWGPVSRGRNDNTAELQKKAAIYEIWDKSERKVYWVSKAWSARPLDERDDPLSLDGFFPCPRPLLATVTAESIIPTADYIFYQDQAEEIDRLTARIQQLQESLKVRGFYAATEKTNLQNLLTSSDAVMIPVADWVSLKEGGGLSGHIEWFPLQQVVSALNAIVEQRRLLMEDVYQLTGIGDLLRGMNDPRATATAERIKGAWGTLRIRTKQVEMMRFCRDTLRIKAEIIAQKFDAETLKAISGVKLPTAEEKALAQGQVEQMKAMAAQQMAAQAAQQPAPAPGQPPGAPMGHNGGPPMPPEIPEPLLAVLESPTWEDVIGLLRNDAARNFRIDVETDSTIEPDDQEQKASVLELIQALGTFMSTWGPMVAAQPALAPLAAGLIQYAVRRFRAGRELESLIDRTLNDLSRMAQQPNAAPTPDKTPVEVQTLKNQQEAMKQQGETQRAQLQAQVDGAEMQQDRQMAELKLVVGQRDPVPQVSF